MARLVALIFLFVAVYVHGYTLKREPEQCNLNEVWNECAVVKSCEPKCGQDVPKFCPTMCVARCQCIEGYKRNLITNLCVPQSCE